MPMKVKRGMLAAVLIRGLSSRAQSSVLSHCQVDIVDLETGQAPDGVSVDNDLRC